MADEYHVALEIYGIMFEMVEPSHLYLQPLYAYYARTLCRVCPYTPTNGYVCIRTCTRTPPVPCVLYAHAHTRTLPVQFAQYARTCARTTPVPTYVCCTGIDAYLFYDAYR